MVRWQLLSLLKTNSSKLYLKLNLYLAVNTQIFNYNDQSVNVSRGNNCYLLRESYQKVPGNANSYLNGLQYGSVAVGCLVCSLYAHVWEVAARCNLSVLCQSCLSEDVRQAVQCIFSVWGKNQHQVYVQAKEEYCRNAAGLADCLWGWCS
jgi:hypothetical protein